MNRPRVLPRSFYGSEAQLRALVLASGVSGAWEERLNGHFQFRSDDGGILNWWQTTGRLLLQGDVAAARSLERAMLEVVDQARVENQQLQKELSRLRDYR